MSHITPWQDPVSFRVFRYDSRPDNCLVRCYLFRMYDLKQGKEQSSPDMLIFCRSVGQKSMRMLSIYRICICPQDVCVCGLSSVFGVKTLYFLAVATWGNFIKATSNIFVKLKSDFFFLEEVKRWLVTQLLWHVTMYCWVGGFGRFGSQCLKFHVLRCFTQVIVQN